MNALEKITEVRHGTLAASFALLLLLAPTGAVCAQTNSEFYPSSTTNEAIGCSTNGPVIFQHLRVSITNSCLTNSALFRLRHRNLVYTNLSFTGYLPTSLHHTVWTNFIAHTNRRELTIWSERSYPTSPTNSIKLKWNTNGLMWGMKGLTGLAPHWEADQGSGHSPITALTRRHGYTRGHGMGTDGFTTNRIGLKVWFVTTANRVVEMKIKQSVVRTRGPGNADYTIVLFDRDLPPDIEPLRVVTFSELKSRYPFPMRIGFPHVLFMTEQTGRVSANVPPWEVNVAKGGDSGCPNLLPLPGELIFSGGRSTTGPTPEMQADMDTLCRMEKLDPRKYQLKWVDLTKYPAY